MKTIKLLMAILLLPFAVFAQQPQTGNAPIYAVNAKYTNGVAPGYYPTKGTGLTLNIGNGTVFCTSYTVREYAGGTLTLANNNTNYVYLDTGSSCAPSSNTTGFSSTTLPIAIVTTSGGVITVIDDVRTNFNGNSGSSPVASCGTVSGDNTSTDCGYQNRQTDTATIPASVSTYGSQNLNINTATHTTAIGTLNGQNTIGQESMLMGDLNGVAASGVNHCNMLWSYLIGYRNVGGGVSYNYPCTGTQLNQVTILGNDNLNYTQSIGDAYFQDVIIGSYNVNTDMTGQTLAGVELDNSQVIGNTAARGIAGSDVTAIGDSAMDNHARASSIANVFSVVAIGQTAGSGIANNESSSTFVGVGAGQTATAYAGTGGTSQVGIGDQAAKNAHGLNTVGVGKLAMGGIAGLSSGIGASGSNNIGVGNRAGAGITTGSSNIEIGNNAGCVGCTNTTATNGVSTGSNNIHIGDSAGPNTATQFDNTIAIGQNSRVTQSNQAVFGSSTITQTITYGITIPGTIYSAAGTALPTCAVGIVGADATVSDATAPTYMGAYTSGGSITAKVICSYNGASYAWLTH